MSLKGNVVCTYAHIYFLPFYPENSFYLPLNWARTLTRPIYHKIDEGNCANLTTSIPMDRRNKRWNVQFFCNFSELNKWKNKDTNKLALTHTVKLSIEATKRNISIIILQHFKTNSNSNTKINKKKNIFESLQTRDIPHKRRGIKKA